MEICVYLLIAWRLALRSKERRDWLLVAFLAGMFGLAAGHLAKFAQTVLISHPEHGYRIWYFRPGVYDGGAHYSHQALCRDLSHTPLPRPATARSRQCVERRRRSYRRGGLACKRGLRRSRSNGCNQASSVSSQPIPTGSFASYMGAQVMNHALPDGSVIGVVGCRRPRLLLPLSRSESGRTRELLRLTLRHTLADERLRLL